MSWLTEDRALGLAAIGSGLSQLAAGQPVNIAGSPAAQMLQQRRQMTTMQESGLLDRFTPEQRAILAQMPPAAAQKVIAGEVFRQPAPVEPVKGMNINGRLVNPVTGQVIADFSEQEAEKPIVREVTLSDGSEALVQWDQQSQSWQPANIPEGGTGAQPRDKLTESQARITLFQSLQEEAAPAIDAIEERYNPANIADAAARNTPLAGNFFQSGDGQVYNAAANQWAEGALRIATGAAAQQQEIDRTRATYFAQVGDKPATIQFKRELRASYTRAIRRALGEKDVTGEVEIPDPDQFAAEFEAEVAPTPAPVTGDIPDPPDGYSQQEWAETWRFMTEEDRALFK